MKKQNTIRDLALAFGVFVFWGNVVSFLLPAEQYGAVVKTVDFASAVFLLAVLITGGVALFRRRRAESVKKQAGEGSGKEERS